VTTIASMRALATASAFTAGAGEIQPLASELIACRIACRLGCCRGSSFRVHTATLRLRCDAGWYGVDCSDTIGLAYKRANLLDDPMQFGEGVRSAQVDALPPSIARHVRRMRHAIYVYQLPGIVNRAAEAWMPRAWGSSRGRG